MIQERGADNSEWEIARKKILDKASRGMRTKVKGRAWP